MMFKSFKILTLMVFGVSLGAFAQGPPPPPGLPIDNGMIFLVIAAVILALYKLGSKKLVKK